MNIDLEYLVSQSAVAFFICCGYGFGVLLCLLLVDLYRRWTK